MTKRIVKVVGDAGTYRYAWATLACVILVVFLAIELWIATVLAAVFTVRYATLLRLLATSLLQPCFGCGSANDVSRRCVEG
jgi:hypothetical protein